MGPFAVEVLAMTFVTFTQGPFPSASVDGESKLFVHGRPRFAFLRRNHEDSLLLEVIKSELDIIFC